MMKISLFMVITTLFYSLNVLAEVEPTTLSFEATPVGQSSQSLQVTMTNPGGRKDSGPINISVELTGDHSTDFTQEHTCPDSLAVSADCIVTVTFIPQAEGERTATLNISDDEVTLTGTATSPATTSGKESSSEGEEPSPVPVNEEPITDSKNSTTSEEEPPTTAGKDTTTDNDVTTTTSDEGSTTGEKDTAPNDAESTNDGKETATTEKESTSGEKESSSPSMPEITQIFSLEETTGLLNDSSAQFSGGISINGGEDFELIKNNVTSLTDTITVSGVIIPEPAHQGQAADIIVVGLYTPEPNETCDPLIGDYYMNAQSENNYCNWILVKTEIEAGTTCNPNATRSSRNGERNYWQRWQGNLKELVSLYYIDTLSEQEMLTVETGKVLYQDNPTYTGYVCLNFGYRLHDSTCNTEACCKQSDKNCILIFNGEPLRFRVVSAQEPQKNGSSSQKE